MCQVNAVNLVLSVFCNDNKLKSTLFAPHQPSFLSAASLLPACFYTFMSTCLFLYFWQRPLTLPSCFSSSFNAAALVTRTFPSFLRYRQSKDVSVIKASGANGGISSHADSLHHRTDRWIPHTDTQMLARPHVNTHTHMQTCNISGGQLKWLL